MTVNSDPQNTPEVKIDQPQTAVPIEQNTETSPPIKTDENKENWRKFREQQKAERLAKEAAEKTAAEERMRAEALKAALEAVTNKPSNNYQMNEYGSQDNEESEEQRIEKLVEKKIKEKEAKQEHERRVREQQELPQKINQLYPDFQKVCSDENIDYLKFHYPEVAAAFNNLPDSVENWSNVYKTVKRLVPNPDHSDNQKKVEQNLAKPGSISKTGVTTGTGVMPSARLSEDRKASNWERMKRTLKGLSN